MKMLIIGGNRFVGAELVSRAALAGHDVTVLALDPPTLRARAHVHFVKADRNDRNALARVLAGQKFDAVLDNIAFVPDNIRLLFEVLQGRIGRYVLTSSVDIYSRDTSHISSEDRAVLEPSSLADAPSAEKYLRGKRGCEKELQNYSVPWAVVRPANVFGRTDPVPPSPRKLHPLHHPYGRSLFMPTRVVDGGPILLRRNDRRVFRLVGVQDVASALLLVAEHPEAIGRAFNVAGDEIWTSERLIRATCEVAGITPDIVRVSDEELRAAGLDDYHSPYGKLQTWSVSDNKQLRELGWTPMPAAAHLAKLVEELPPPSQRPFYGRRLQEIALAERLKRQRLITVLPRIRTVPTVGPSLEKRPESSDNLPGRFSAAAAEQWKAKVMVVEDRQGRTLHKDHFRAFRGAPVSSIGIGTHRGDESVETDDGYRAALLMAIQSGLNVVDTAINYRKMRAERLVGRVLKELQSLGVPREAVCVCSKGGFVPQDIDDRRPADRYIRDMYLSAGLIGMRQAVRRHCIASGFIRKSLAQSLENLRLAHIDVYYLHNPERSKIQMKNEDFFKSLRKTFAMLEGAVALGKIGVYGLATWEGLLVDEKAHAHLPLERIVQLAREVGGEKHHLRALQVPFNISNQDALRKQNQSLQGKKDSVLAVAAAYGLYVFTSASVDRGNASITNELSTRISACCTDLDPIQTALQFTRSAPGVGTALIGIRLPRYAENALEIGRYPVLGKSAFMTSG